MATGNTLSVESVLDDDTYFVKSYDVFKGRYKMPTGPDWATEIIAKIDTRIIQSVKESTGRTLKALGIGTGNAHFDEVHQCILEPNKDMINQHKANVSQNELKGVTYEWREQRLEEFMTSQKEDEKYHFITAIHSLYHVHNLDEALGFLYDKLEENGILLMVLGIDTGLFARVSSIIPSQYNRVVSFSTRSLLDCFRTRGISCEVHNYPLPGIDLSGCLDNDSNDGSMLLDFLTHVKGFTKAPFESGMKEEVFATIRETEMEAKSLIDVEAHEVVIVQKKNHKN
ncbi:histamine N-methyltransferase-like isoform X2 [Amphiura filiformis]|uniref:histamine N-methyltransferase-like isoform X2 n=1 Tax=Amphiura filiformis TaxID=82378 RepID=UPI003B21EB3D